MSRINKRLQELSAKQRALLKKMLEREKAAGSKSALPVPRITPAPEARNRPFALTDIQRAYWFARSGLLDITAAGLGYVELECDGMDIDRIQTALRRIIADNDQLRMVVRPNLQQQVLADVPDYEIRVYDLRSMSDDVAARAQADIRRRMTHQILPAETWPIFEVCASARGNDRLRIHFSFDLLVGDAWCFRMLIDEWARVYDDLDGGRKPPRELRYRDYVQALESLEGTALFDRDLAYWRKQFETLPPPPRLPVARSPAELDCIRSEHWTIRLTREEWAGLKQKLGRERLTTSGFFAAALSEVITLWNPEPRHALNIAVSNRLPMHPDIEQILVGVFNSFQVLAVENGVAANFAKRARTLQSLLREHQAHCWVSGLRLMRELAQVRGTSAGESLMPVVFASPLPDHESEQNMLPRVLGKRVYEVFQTPPVWMEHHVWEEDGELLLHIDVVEGLFPKGMMSDFVGAYEKLIRRLGADDTGWQEPNGHYLLPDHQRKAWRDYNNTGDDDLPRGYLQTAFEARAAQQPDAPAVISASGTLTFAELDVRANQLAHWLRDRGARPDQLVAVVAPRGYEQVLACMAIVKAGAAYLPIDADSPQDRLDEILADGRVELVVGTTEVAGRYRWPLCVRLAEIDGENFASLPVTPPMLVHTEDCLACVIYTSGSTGKHKSKTRGVMIDHRGAVNTIADINRRIGLEGSDRVFAVSALSLDLSVYDIFGTLSAGATIVMPDQQSPDPKRWIELATEHGVTLLNSVPALVERLVMHAEARGTPLPQTLRCCLISGDRIPLSLPARLRAANPGINILSLGGATETSIWSVVYPVNRVDPDWHGVPYGMPLSNQRVYVLNKFLQPCPFWVQGDIYIGGTGVARGYWGDDEETRARFITHPKTGERLYRTGDLGRLLPEGYIELLGRADSQVEAVARTVKRPVVKQVEALSQDEAEALIE